MTGLRTLVGAALACLALGATAQAQVVSMATGAQGSLAYNSGQAVARLANDNGVTVRTQPLVGYMPMLQNGEVDFGYANGAEAAFAYTATGNFDRKHENIRIAGVMFPLTTGIMAPCDMNLASVNDLVGKAKDLRIASEYASSTIIPFYIKGALASAGLKYEDFKQVPVASFVDGINALGDGLVDIALVSLNAGAGQEAAVKLKDRGGLCYISVNNTEQGMAEFSKFLPAGYVAELPKNENVNGLQTRGAVLIRVPWMLLTNAGVSDDLVYKMVKLVAENKDALGAAFGPFKQADAKIMAPKNLMPYHPGALRYYHEAGIPTDK